MIGKENSSEFFSLASIGSSANVNSDQSIGAIYKKFSEIAGSRDQKGILFIRQNPTISKFCTSMVFKVQSEKQESLQSSPLCISQTNIEQTVNSQPSSSFEIKPKRKISQSRYTSQESNLSPSREGNSVIDNQCEEQFAPLILPNFKERRSSLANSDRRPSDSLAKTLKRKSLMINIDQS